MKKDRSKYRFNNIWHEIQRRCTNENAKIYRNYGGRGIKCLWNSYKEFKHDMHESYLFHVKEHGVKNTTIDRVDNDGHYHKANCRWATHKQQANNRRSTIKIKYKGEEKTILDWSKEIGITQEALYCRYKRKWALEEMMTQPFNKNRFPVKRKRFGKGYYWNKAHKRWIAQGSFKGKLKHLGVFKEEAAAANAYKQFIQSLS